jgi:hypothetical protein
MAEKQVYGLMEDLLGWLGRLGPVPHFVELCTRCSICKTRHTVVLRAARTVQIRCCGINEYRGGTSGGEGVPKGALACRHPSAAAQQAAVSSIINATRPKALPALQL